jgi:hypothetical protein
VTEEQPYEVVRHFDGFEIRRYPSHLVAEVTTRLPFEQAGNSAFGFLFGYISGRNQSKTSVAMTAPVIQRTAQEGYSVAFVLPANMTAQSAPEPTNPKVTIRAVPPSLAAATRYSGRWSQSSFETHRARLLARIEGEGFAAIGTPRFARFDPPFKPWFLRRNEVIVDVQEDSGAPH